MIRTLTPKTTHSTPMEPIKVLCASLNGKLAIHRSINQLGYTLTHIPSGFGIYARIVSYQDAEDLMLQIENANWNFRSPRSKIWTEQTTALWKIVRKVEQHYFI